MNVVKEEVFNISVQTLLLSLANLFLSIQIQQKNRMKFNHCVLALAVVGRASAGDSEDYDAIIVG